MTAKDYEISFGYGQYDGVWYTKDRPHRGNDRLTPTGTQVVIGDTVLGLTGATGLVEGPHVHTQAGRDEWAQQTIDPTPYEFQPGTVVKTGFADQWGNYVCVRTGDVNVFYCHLSEIKVSEGKVIEGGDMTINNREEGKALYLMVQHRHASDAEADGLIGRKLLDIMTGWLDTEPDNQEWHLANHTLLSAYPLAVKTIEELKTQLASKQDLTKDGVIKYLTDNLK